MREDGAIAAFALGKRANKLHDATPKINRQSENSSELDHNRVHFPEPIMKIDSQQRFADAQMRGGTYREKLGQSFDDSEKDRQQIFVHLLSL